jgi:hypothetical protein
VLLSVDIGTWSVTVPLVKEVDDFLPGIAHACGNGFFNGFRDV